MLSLAHRCHPEGAQAEALFTTSLQPFQRRKWGCICIPLCRFCITIYQKAVTDIHVHQSNVRAAYLQITFLFFFPPSTADPASSENKTTGNCNLHSLSGFAARQDRNLVPVHGARMKIAHQKYRDT